MNLNSEDKNKVSGREGQTDGQIVRLVKEFFHVLLNKTPIRALFIPDTDLGECVCVLVAYMHI